MSFFLLVLLLICMVFYYLVTDLVKFNKVDMKSILSLILLVEIVFLHSIIK